MTPSPSLPSSSRALRGFSLMELLLAIAVVALLAVFGVAALRPARMQAHRAQDIENLKSIGQAFFIWTGEHRYQLPAIVGPAVPNYIHETLASQMGITQDLRDPTLTREQLGPWISPGDQRKPLSALRSYGVNYYMGPVHLATSSKIVYRYHEIVDPSRTLYFMPSEGASDNPSQQARFSDTTWPFNGINGAKSTFSTRFDNGTTPALMADGHVELLSLEDAPSKARWVLPKQPKR